MASAKAHTNNDNLRKRDDNTISNTTAAKIFCDLDGVLVDFNKGIYRLLRKDATKLYKTKNGIKRLWSAVDRTPKFFEKLHWTSDGRDLWQSIYHLQPDILTGVPNNKPDQVGREKFRWCQRELLVTTTMSSSLTEDDDTQKKEMHDDSGRAVGGKRTTRGGTPKCNMVFNHIDMAARNPQRHDTVSGSKRIKATNCDVTTTTTNEEIVINVISCWSRYKHCECTVPGSILIDDRETLQTDWEAAGGVFVHHVDTPSTLQKLRELGIPLKNIVSSSKKQQRRQQHHNNKATNRTSTARHTNHHHHHRTTGGENHANVASSNKSHDHHNNNNKNSHKRNAYWRNHAKKSRAPVVENGQAKLEGDDRTLSEPGNVHATTFN